MTKTERILSLYKTGEYTTRQIADVVGCRTEYVRVVARQRKGASYSKNDAAYLMEKFGGKTVKEAVRNWSRTPERQEQIRQNNRRFRAKRRAEARA